MTIMTARPPAEGSPPVDLGLSPRKSEESPHAGSHLGHRLGDRQYRRHRRLYDARGDCRSRHHGQRPCMVGTASAVRGTTRSPHT